MKSKLLLVALTLGAAAPAVAVPAIQSGLVGLYRLQTARVSVANLTEAQDPDFPRPPARSRRRCAERRVPEARA
jgi:hypothetical protein